MIISSATGWVRIAFFRSTCIGVATMMLGCLIPISAGGRSAETNDRQLQDLDRIGLDVSKAVLSKNIPKLLIYSRPDLRISDEAEFKDNKSDLYCYIFRSSCLTGRRSVYDKLSSATRLGIKVRDLGKSSDGRRYGLLLFYDRASISDRLLLSNDFLCQASAKRIASWTFVLVNDHWQTANPLFDSETDTLCND